MQLLCSMQLQALQGTKGGSGLACVHIGGLPPAESILSFFALRQQLLVACLLQLWES